MDFQTAVDLTKGIDLVGLIGQVTPLKKVSTHEYAGGCPKCGGKDRFHVHQEKGWFCRVCQGETKFHDAIDFRQWMYGERITQAIENLLGGRKLDRGAIERISLERNEREQARRAEEHRQQEAARDRLQAGRVWETYHANEAGRELWRARGISDDWQDYYCLGYCPPRGWMSGDTRFTSASLTIPYLRYIAPLQYTCTSLKHRLLCNDAPGGKYRPEFAGLGNQIYFPMHEEPMLPRALLVEGEIKAMVVQIALWSLDPLPNITVCAVAGKSVKPELIAEFSECERVWIMLDPDAKRQAEELADTLGKERTKIINLPDKVDDLITMGVIDGPELWGLMEA